MIGRDSPGAVAEVTRAVAGGGAIGDSSMSLLDGYLTMTLVVSAGLSGDVLGENLTRGIPGLAVAVTDLARPPVTPPTVAASEGAPASPGSGEIMDADRLGYALTLHGPSGTDALSVTTGLLAEAGCSVTSMTTRVAGNLFVLVADVELPAQADVASLMRAMAAALDGFRIAFRPADPAVM
ncbi:glycine cleavage system transcriptional repressor [Planotetraspora phitsanulokensis]|uniref:glycine cleavage system transcriptional repressor n=1 Tax=Planotetraspora phitsanulokensis TaxID=575192 RepID=UPI00194DB80D|nr:glycine cleavage system transcriptional repressor [Planotetraspora phitsanulokensis]